MSEPTHLGRIIEFLYRIDIAEKIKEEPDIINTNELIEFILSLAIADHWDVEEAIDRFNVFRECWFENEDLSVRKFNAWEILNLDSATNDIWQTNNVGEIKPLSKRQVNEQFLGYKLEPKVIKLNFNTPEIS